LPSSSGGATSPAGGPGVMHPCAMPTTRCPIPSVPLIRPISSFIVASTISLRLSIAGQMAGQNTNRPTAQ